VELDPDPGRQKRPKNERTKINIAGGITWRPQTKYINFFINTIFILFSKVNFQLLSSMWNPTRLDFDPDQWKWFLNLGILYAKTFSLFIIFTARGGDLKIKLLLKN
jgi:hypothetical protein